MGTSPLARTTHPEDKWGDAETELEQAVKAASEADMPVSMEDPYCPAPSTCILCPRRFALGCAPQPDYKNPKLLSQFVSPHGAGLRAPRDRAVQGDAGKC